MEPQYVEGEEYGPVGATRRDDLNPEPAKRSQAIVGSHLLDEYRHNGKRWEGKIYDPESSNLKVRGYIGIPMLGRTAIFAPMALCIEVIKTMLKRSSRPSCSK